MDVKLFRIGGIAAIVEILGALVYFVVVGPFMPAPGTPTADALKNLATAPPTVLWFGWEGVLVDILAMAAGLALYFALREGQPGYAALALAGMLLGQVIVMLNDARISSLSWELARAFASGNAAQQAAALVTAGAVDRWIEGTTQFAGGALVGSGYGLFGLAMLSSSRFPRWLGWIGLVGGVLMVLGGLLSPFAQVGGTLVLVSFLPNFAWTFISGIYLLRIKVPIDPGLHTA